jgi:hypothetical protein
MILKVVALIWSSIAADSRSKWRRRPGLAFRALKKFRLVA